VEEALGWAALAASSLVIGGLLGVARHWPDRDVGLVLAFGAGALISAVSFDLAEEGAAIGGPGYVALGLAGGAITYFVASRQLDRRGGGGTGMRLLSASSIYFSAGPSSAGWLLWYGLAPTIPGQEARQRAKPKQDLIIGERTIEAATNPGVFQRQDGSQGPKFSF